MILSALLMILVQPHGLPSLLVKGLHRCRICCSWTSLSLSDGFGDSRWHDEVYLSREERTDVHDVR